MKRLVWFAVVIVALAFAAVSVAAAPGHRVSARLSTRVEVPKPVHTAKRAGGAFTARYVVHAKDVKLVWRLSFKHLTGSATAATLSMGKPGLIGTPVTVLCKPCKSGKGATSLLQKAMAGPLRAGQLYVTVYTSQNPAGELRGQILAKR